MIKFMERIHHANMVTWELMFRRRDRDRAAAGRIAGGAHPVRRRVADARHPGRAGRHSSDDSGSHPRHRHSRATRSTTRSIRCSACRLPPSSSCGARPSTSSRSWGRGRSWRATAGLTVIQDFIAAHKDAKDADELIAAMSTKYPHHGISGRCGSRRRIAIEDGSATTSKR